jgi:cysteine desulfurase nifS
MIYLDNAATTALSETARKAMEPYLSGYYGNPSSIYRFGQEARKAVEESRQSIASLFHVSPREIYFTGGGTEGDNWAISSVVLESALKKEKSVQLITSTIEHPAVLRTCAFFESLGVKVSRIPVDQKGFLDLEALERALQEESSLREREERSFSSKSGEEAKKGASHCLVSVMAANNEIGTLQNLREIGRLAKEYGAVFHTDAVQAFGQIPLNIEEMRIDLLSASSHKIHGPKGVGLLYIRKGLKLPSFLHGGAQERGLRAGTENVPGIVGFSAAAKEAFSTMEERGRKKVALRDLFFKRLLEEIPGVKISGVNPLEDEGGDSSKDKFFLSHETGKSVEESILKEVKIQNERNNYLSLLHHRLPGNVHICLPGVEGESVLLLLDQKGICASSGSACASGSLEPSHVLLAIGKSHEEAYSGLRLSLEETLTEEELEYTVRAIKEAVEKLRG